VARAGNLFFWESRRTPVCPEGKVLDSLVYFTKQQVHFKVLSFHDHLGFPKQP
jgi:hypothetical protein